MMSKKDLLDLGERTVWTFIQAFLAVAILDGNITDLTALKTAAVAGLLAVGKFILLKANTVLSK